MANHTEDDDSWLRTLQSGSGPHRDAILVRAALRRHARRMDEKVPVADEHLYQQLRFRLRSEGLSHGRTATWMMAAAASIVTIALGISVYRVQQSTDTDYRSVRGDRPANFVARSIEPRDAAIKAQAQLLTNGLGTELRQDGESWVIVAPATLEAIDVADRLGLVSERVNNRLEIRFTRK